MPRTPDHWPNLASLLLVSMMGAAILTLLPLWVGGLSENQLFSAQQIGWLAAADVIGIFASSASAIVWVRRVPWRPAVIGGLTLFLLGNLLSLSCDNFAQLMAIRIISGLGCGTAYAIALAGLGDHRRPELAFGLMVSAQVAFGTIGFFAAPRLMAIWQVDGFFHYLNGWLLLALLSCALAFPHSQKQRNAGDTGALALLLNRRALLVFATTVVYYCGVSAVWAYLERIGVHLGLDSARVGDLLGIGFAISGAGSLATPSLARRCGRSVALGASIALQVLTMALLLGDGGGHALVLYATASIVFQFFWSFTIPLLMEQFNRVDASGRFIVLCASAFKVGEILGPPLAAALLQRAGFAGVLALGIGAISLAMAMGLRSERGARERPAADTAAVSGA